jgi:hypothetical protein
MRVSFATSPYGLQWMLPPQRRVVYDMVTIGRLSCRFLIVHTSVPQ